MTQKDQYIALLTSFGLKQGTGELTGDFHVGQDGYGKPIVRLHAGVGYCNFYADMVFDDEGNFVEHGVYE